MIQFSYQTNNNALDDAVNGFWFTSLVFSISAAVNSLLGLTWMQAVLYVLSMVRVGIAHLRLFR